MADESFRLFCKIYYLLLFYFCYFSCTCLRTSLHLFICFTKYQISDISLSGSFDLSQIIGIRLSLDPNTVETVSSFVLVTFSLLGENIRHLQIKRGKIYFISVCRAFSSQFSGSKAGGRGLAPGFTSQHHIQPHLWAHEA